MEQDQKSYLPAPHFLMCNKDRYNKEKLEAMGLPEDFFDNRNPDRTIFDNNKSFPDLNSTWQRATWPLTDFEADWRRYEGMDEDKKCKAFLFYYFLNSIQHC